MREAGAGSLERLLGQRHGNKGTLQGRNMHQRGLAGDLPETAVLLG